MWRTLKNFPDTPPSRKDLGLDGCGHMEFSCQPLQWLSQLQSLTQGHILSWSIPHSVTARCDSICMSDHLHPSGDILNAHSIPELFLRQSFKAALQINFFLCSILLSSPLFCWCWSQRHLLIHILPAKFCSMVYFPGSLWFEENRDSERKTKINPQTIWPCKKKRELRE